MMSQRSKRELLATIRPRYRKASKKEKEKSKPKKAGALPSAIAKATKK